MMYKSKGFLFLIIIFSVIHLTAFAKDDLVKIKNLSKKADIILTGKVSHKQSNWNANKTKIFTKTTIQVSEYLKGQAGINSVEVTYPGGEVGDVGELYTHMPTFENDEEVLVFLKKDKNNKVYHVLNGDEGKIKIQKETKSKDKNSGPNSSINDLKSQIKRFINE